MCKGWSDAVDQRRTNKQWPIERGEKGETTVYKTLHRKLKIEQHEHY